VNAARSGYLKTDGSPDVDPSDPGLLADVVMVTRDNNVLVAKGTGSGLAAPAEAGSFGGAVADKVVFGDFDGDLLTDVGLVRYGAGTTLQVMLAKGDGTFAAPADWSAALALPAGAFVAAGDVNGDGKQDLIVRDSRITVDRDFAAQLHELHIVGTMPQPVDRRPWRGRPQRSGGRHSQRQRRRRRLRP